MDSCELQTLGNVICMILAAFFAGVRMSRCRTISSSCFTCERDIESNYTRDEVNGQLTSELPIPSTN